MAHASLTAGRPAGVDRSGSIRSVCYEPGYLVETVIFHTCFVSAANHHLSARPQRSRLVDRTAVCACFVAYMLRKLRRAVTLTRVKIRTPIANLWACRGISSAGKFRPPCSRTPFRRTTTRYIVRNGTEGINGPWSDQSSSSVLWLQPSAFARPGSARTMRD